MKSAILAENLSKRFLIDRADAKASYRTLREDLTSMASLPFRWMNNTKAESPHEEVWALRDVNFSIEPGEIVGIVGRNGSGKSTLLKIISRITPPTEGRVRLRGRVGSLLEVGTGFHPELTGRENVFLSGAILGMSRAEIRNKYQQIVEFAEVDRFLETPVKRYSSGMFVRLAFAVAAHLDPEILLIDEVLAVGDAGFQKKCLTKMGEVANQGRTIVIVSHQMQAIQAICKKAILLSQGRVERVGPTSDVVAAYMGSSRSKQDLSGLSQLGTKEARFEEVIVSTERAKEPEVISQGERLEIAFKISVAQKLRDVNLAVAVRNGDGLELFSHAWSEVQPVFELEPGEHWFKLRLPTQYLRPGMYWLTLALSKNFAENVALLPAIELPPISLAEDADPILESRRWGVVLIPCDWERG